MDITTTILKLADSGVLGIMLAVCLYFLITLFKELIAEKDKRIDDEKTRTNTLIVTLDKNTDALKEITLKLVKVENDSEKFHDAK